ncbi:uncharacterized protein HD556DRAFT_1309151 [Suillus plorans]|uniref:Uncharacterized protein n=1 Tax=Suillus plorans TaxID=116603 RepID=A0A9P7APQ3_9AGAM|nr:uncharacterized protein HD556DRAFT_1309151 [Suillus plorans]KAG1792600.1 hypothetical protein HD556DRAFT_1309151 [Suillus plorans]
MLMKNSDLEINVFKVLDSVPIASMWRTVQVCNEITDFMDAYYRGLNRNIFMVLSIIGTLFGLKGITCPANTYITPWSQHVRFAESVRGLHYLQLLIAFKVDFLAVFFELAFAGMIKGLTLISC